LPFIACGASGLVSVAANIIPDVIARLVRACLNGSFDEALVLQKRYYPLMRGLMTLDVNPVPIKTAAAMQGHCSGDFRLPLVPMSAPSAAELAGLLERFGLIEP
jgi:4-hydroxy-tetrahydrodipicolinate synthase